MTSHTSPEPRFFFPLALRGPLGYARLWVPKEGEACEPLDVDMFATQRVEEAAGILFPKQLFPKQTAWEPTPTNGDSPDQWRGASANLAHILAVAHTFRPLRLNKREIWASGLLESNVSEVAAKAPRELTHKVRIFAETCDAHKSGHEAVMFLPLGQKTQLSETLDALQLNVLQWPAQKEACEEALMGEVGPTKYTRPTVLFFPPHQLDALLRWLQGVRPPRTKLRNWLLVTLLWVLSLVLVGIFAQQPQRPDYYPPDRACHSTPNVIPIYQWYYCPDQDWVTIGKETNFKQLFSWGYTSPQFLFYAFAKPPPKHKQDLIPVYRMGHPKILDWVTVAGKAQIAHFKAKGYKNLTLQFYAFRRHLPGTFPVYRWYNQAKKDWKTAGMGNYEHTLKARGYAKKTKLFYALKSCP